LPLDIFGWPEADESVLPAVGLPLILSMISLVPAPSAAPVSAFVIALVVEFVLVFGVLTVGFTTDVGDVVLVVGVVAVLLVTVGLVVGVVLDVNEVRGTKVVLGVADVPVVREGFALPETDEVKGRLLEPPADVIEDEP